MSADPLPNRRLRFVQDRLPWLIGGASLVLYLATLARWVTLDSIAQVARVNAWNWQPTLSQPLLYLLTCPFRWVAADAVPLALNAGTALCASLTLAMLARSVALLPYVRLKQQRLLVQGDHPLLGLPGHWIPVALAAGALGLQLTFWEHATAASGEMLDLLLLAYVIRCLLEYRVGERPSWLDRAALAFGAAMANNAVMIGLAPLFVMAVLWTRRMRFFGLRALRRLVRSTLKDATPAFAADVRFFGRLALFALAGLSLLFLLPLVAATSQDSTWNFWQALHATAAASKAALKGFGAAFLRYHRDLAVLLSAVCLLPLLVLLSINWGAFASGRVRTRAGWPSFILHTAHAFLLFLSLWLVFDPPFSPRRIGPQVGLASPLLPLYYFAALAIGYCSGFFLLLSGARALLPSDRNPSSRRRVGFIAPIAGGLLTGLALGGLIFKNLPVIQAGNAGHLARYAQLAAESLPPGAIVLGYDPVRLALLQAALVHHGDPNRHLLVDARYLPFPDYRRWLRGRYPGRWPEAGPETGLSPAKPENSSRSVALDPVGLVQLLSRIVQTNRVYSLHPNLGLLQEQFDLLPHGLVHELRFYPADSFSGLPLTPAQLAENQTFWRRATDAGIHPLLQHVAPPDRAPPGLGQRLMQLARVTTSPSPAARAMALWYSSALNGWGVTLQRQGRLIEAAPCFALAEKLNANNLPARINRQSNANLLAGPGLAALPPRPPPDRLGEYRDWARLLADNGPVDEPGCCYQLGLNLAAAGLLRQAGQQLERVKTLAPHDLLARLLLADLFNRCRMPDRALRAADEIRADPAFRPLPSRHEIELAFLEATAWYVKTNRPRAEAIIHSLLTAHAGDPALLDRAGAAFTAHHSYSNALHIAARQLQASPANVDALVNQGSLCLLVGDYSNAVPPLTRALALTNTYPARLNRAFAYLRTGRLEAAEADYHELLRAFPAAYRAAHGLAEIAWQRKDTNTAIHRYRQYLAQAPAGTEEARLVTARLRALQPAPP